MGREIWFGGEVSLAGLFSRIGQLNVALLSTGVPEKLSTDVPIHRRLFMLRLEYM